MDIDNTQESRLMARGIPSDDPAWGQVSAFLTAVESTYPNVGAVPLEASHLAAISRELRLLQAEPRPAQRKTMKDFLKLKTHRVLFGSLIAALVALTAGVGVAAAMGGGDPLKPLVPASQPEVTPTPEESPTAESTESEESQEVEDHSASADDTQEETDQSSQHESEDSNDDSDDQTADDSDEADDSDDSSEHAQPTNDSDDDSDEADDDSPGSDQSGDQSVDDEPGEH
ncbi:MAG: hypothetical protein L6256_11310 [Propionicimonas sp.]|uniref:hypothetical protein n=1 Tax=Propionicimonas sp. TaxID=1955623 RepID=UPI001DA01762|nr:hypothetical protein [Propionicimonas sp.]MBU4189192.1 hypothetical protein [Actinomycetota bacterium]MBU4205383.1 hypothetical protein [Actinomycetota bacterium]MBU4250686.1 hypothetical protein [Actinomycetota bacterium]MBU4365295.1 hypothetical protein [Actinomycetota bacterium]MBU4411339.1 hypothetical protein [Actinomycetota bacterium]